ncbi:MAG TPA: GspH/FimT family pseudopilin, partial [Pseudoduganella sp.]
MRTPHPHEQRAAPRHRPLPQLLALKREGRGPAGTGPGFTLLELMIVLAILSILFASALPNLSNMLAGRQLRSASADLLAAINDTRAQAIARRRVVTLLAENGNWQQGWLIIIDANANRSPDAGEAILSRHKAAPERLLVRARFTDNTAPAYISYNAAGRSCRAAHPNAANF